MFLESLPCKGLDKAFNNLILNYMPKTTEEIESILEDNLLKQSEAPIELGIKQGTREELRKAANKKDGTLVDMKRGGIIPGKEGGDVLLVHKNSY